MTCNTKNAGYLFSKLLGPGFLSFFSLSRSLAIEQLNNRLRAHAWLVVKSVCSNIYLVQKIEIFTLSVIMF